MVEEAGGVAQLIDEGCCCSIKYCGCMSLCCAWWAGCLCFLLVLIELWFQIELLSTDEEGSITTVESGGLLLGERRPVLQLGMVLKCAVSVCSCAAT